MVSVGLLLFLFPHLPYFTFYYGFTSLRQCFGCVYNNKIDFDQLYAFRDIPLRIRSVKDHL